MRHGREPLSSDNTMVRKPLIFLGWAGCLVPGLFGCAGTRQEVYAPRPAAGPERGVIFSVDGAGGRQNTSAALSQAVLEERLPLRVEPVVWSHGRGRALADQTDLAHAREQGRRLAEQIAA